MATAQAWPFSFTGEDGRETTLCFFLTKLNQYAIGGFGMKETNQLIIGSCSWKGFYHSKTFICKRSLQHKDLPPRTRYDVGLRLYWQ
jgi:hypothetical protein